MAETKLGYRPVLALVAVGVAKFGPYLAAGPGFLLDDWRFAYNVRFHGTWEVARAGGATARPGSFVAFAAMFGSSQSPMVLAGMLAALNIAVAVVAYLVLRRWLPQWEAAVAAGAWLLTPSHSGTDYWISAAVGPLALLLLGLGVLALARGYGRDRSLALSGLLLVASVLVYELTILFALAALVAVPLLERKPIRWPFSVGVASGIGAAAVVIFFQTPYVSRRWLDVSEVWSMSFDLGQPGLWGQTLVGAGSLAILAVAFVGWRRERDGEPWPAGRRVLIGLAMMGLGIAPALRFPLGLDGLGDRVTVLAAVGAAVALAAVLSLLPRRSLAVVALGAVAFVGGLSGMGDYIDAGDDGREWLADHRGGTVSSADLPAPHGGVFSLCCDYVTTAAVRLTVDDSNAREVRVID